MKDFWPKFRRFSSTMLKYKNYEYLFSLLYFCSLLFCSILFLVLMYDVWDKYSHGLTNIGVRFRDDGIDVKTLPCFSFCSLTAFKSEKNYFYKESEFLANTYTKEDILEKSFLGEIESRSNATIQEIRSDYNGRCYTIQYQEAVRDNKHEVIKLNRATDLQVYIHRCSEEIWLTTTSIPTANALVTIIVENKTDIPYARFTISEKEITYLNRKQSPCKNYDKESYVDCCKNAFELLSKANLTCTTTGLVNITKSKTLKECNSVSDAYKTFYFFAYFFQNITKKLTELGCPLPCKQTTYKTNLQYYHANKWVDPNNTVPRPKDYLYLAVYYDTLLVDEGIEAYVYDLGIILAQAGGNLGLCLGFSCLSALLAFIQFFKQKYIS